MDALILAAGKSTRMGTNKLLLPYMKGTLLSSVIDSVQESDFDRTYIIVSRETLSAAKALKSNSIWVILNEMPEAGQSSSLRLGVRAIASSESPFCVLLGDMPMISGETLRRLHAVFLTLSHKKTAMVPVRDNRFGHPSWFRTVWKQRLLKSVGDIGGREVIEEYRDEVSFISGEDACFYDVDTPRDYELLTGKEVCPPVTFK